MYDKEDIPPILPVIQQVIGDISKQTIISKC